jgi:hypothetical protein
MEHKLVILEYNYWEHFKYAKDIAMVLPHGHPTRISLETKLNEYIKEINELKLKIKVGKS